MVRLLGDLRRVRVARVIAEAFGYRRQQVKRMNVSWRVFWYM